MNDDFLKGMRTHYDYHEKKGNLFKIKHLIVTIQDYTYTNGWGIGSKQDYAKVKELEKKLLEDSDSGKGYYLSKIEKRRCNFIYNKYKIDGILTKHPGLWARNG
jgi:hypothetical protein